jgi:ADP-ribose pyrophosphatase YjhB (NUDIX family)
MKNYIYLSLIITAIMTPLSYGMQLTVEATSSETNGVFWKKDNFGNIWPNVQAIESNELGTKLEQFVTGLQEKEKGNAFLVHLPHEEGQKAVALVKAGFKPHYTDTSKTEWVYKNGSPMPDVSTATAGARVLVCRGKDVLIIEDKNMKGRVMYPGGSVDACELALNAACREIKEEVGLMIHPVFMQKIALVNRVRANRYGVSDYCHYYMTRTFTGTVQAQESEVLQTMWVPLTVVAKGDPINNLKISPTVKLLAAHIISNYHTASQRVLDPRQYPAAPDKQDQSDIMDIDLFHITHHETK